MIGALFCAKQMGVPRGGALTNRDEVTECNRPLAEQSQGILILGEIGPQFPVVTLTSSATVVSGNLAPEG